MIRNLEMAGDWRIISDIFEEIKSIVEEYQDIDYSTLVDGGIQWTFKKKKVNLLPNKYFSRETLLNGNLGLLLLQGRVLNQTEREVEIIEKGTENIINRMKIIKMHPKDAKDLNLNEGDLVRVTDEKSKSFDAKLEADFHLQGTVSYTSLFGEMVTDVSQSKDDWAPNIPDLDFKVVKVKKIGKEQ